MKSHQGIILFCVLLVSRRGDAKDNYLKDTSQSAVQPGELHRDLEDESLWCSPQHVHLSYAKSDVDVSIMWATRGYCSMLVKYANHTWNLDHQAEERQVELHSSVNNSLKYLHRAELQNLLHSTTYYYRIVTTNEVGSNVFFFKLAGDVNETKNFMLASGLDKTIMRSIPDKIMTGIYNTFIYTGDLESKLDLKFKEPPDSFMAELAKFSSLIPVLTIPGKKVEGRDDGLYLYRNMFSSPNTVWPTPPNKLWYSLDIGLVHFISYSTDILFDPDSTNSILQKTWLVDDLTQANRRRNETPWVIAFGHHPMYCALGIKDLQDCLLNTSRVKQGFEDIFYHFAVDLIVQSKHLNYERSWPQYKGVVVGTNYQQPRAPVQVILGSAEGPFESKEENSTTSPTAEWLAFYLNPTKLTNLATLSIINASHLEWKLLASDGLTVLDQFVLVQDNHGNFSLSSLPHNISHQINQTIIALGGKPGTYDFISGSTGNPNEGEGWSKYSLWIGLAALATVVTLLLGAVAIKSCLRSKRKARAGRRWREVDSQTGVGSFYSVASDSDSGDNDFEIDVCDKATKPSSKLLTSY